MIRHSSSFLISIFLHLLILVAVFFVYDKFISQPVEPEEKHICIDLCTITPKTQEKPLKKVVPKPSKQPEPIKKKKVAEKKVVQKKVQSKVPLKKEFIKVEEELIEPKPIEKKIEQVAPVQEEYLESKIVEKSELQEDIETQEEKNKRLENEYIDENIHKIREMISENLYYPRRARKRGVVGEVVVKFHLLKDASVNKVTVVSSEHEILSRAAIKTIENLTLRLPQPKTTLILHVPIVYSLRN